ncbi:MAG: hypothetical protein V4539_24780 [Bacteroidota bacterium]
MKEEVWKLVTSIFGGIGVIGGFVYWHFKTVNGFKDEIHKIEMKCRSLEQSDTGQQKEIDRLMNVYAFIEKNILNK